MNSPIRTNFALSGLVFLLLSASLSASEVTITIEDKKQRLVHDTVVELIGISPKATVEDDIEITQVDKEFSPEVSVFPRGTSVLFTNKDPFQHHVYSVSKGNQFDLPLYKGTPSEHIQFDSPGIVKLGCNIHDWMLAFAYVSQSEYLVVTDAGGKARFSDIPEGEYELRIWNPRLKNNKKFISQPLSVGQNLSIEQIVTLSLRKKVRKPRRNENSNYSG
jgi:plastocyanin